MNKKHTELWIAMGVLLVILLSVMIFPQNQGTSEGVPVVSQSEAPQTAVLYPPVEETGEIDLETIITEIPYARELLIEGYKAEYCLSREYLREGDIVLVQDFLRSFVLKEANVTQNKEGYGKNNVVFEDYFNMQIDFGGESLSLAANNGNTVLVTYQSGDNVVRELHQGSHELFRQLVTMTEQAEVIKEAAEESKIFSLSDTASVQIKSGLSGRGAVIEDPAVIAKIANNMGDLVFLWTANLEPAPGYAYDLVFLDDSGVIVDGFMILDTEGTQIYCNGWSYTADGNGKIDVAYIAELIEE